nr:reverse transcriptase domain-containing protein [Tanacetum cinerariifolium]
MVPQPALAFKSNEIPERNPYRPPIPYPLRLNKDKLQDKSDIQIHKFLQMFKKLHFKINFAKALAQMLKYVKMLKDFLINKEKLLELANTPLNENCELEECMALSNLGSSINLMPLSMWKKLILPKLIPTHMTLELANQSVTYSAGIAEDVFVQVEPSDTFLLGDKEIKFNPLKDIDDPVPILKDSDESKTETIIENVQIHSSQSTAQIPPPYEELSVSLNKSNKNVVGP